MDHVQCSGETQGMRPNVHQVGHDRGEDEEALWVACRLATEIPTKKQNRTEARYGDKGYYQCGELGHVAHHCPAPAPLRLVLQYSFLSLSQIQNWPPGSSRCGLQY